MLSLSGLANALSGNTSTSLTEFQNIIKTWEESRTSTSFDPTDVLTKLSELLEKEHEHYAASDPDPFEDRHPHRVDPECQLGQLLKHFFKKESLVQDLFNNYLKDNYWIQLGQTRRDSFLVNVAAARLVLGILPALQTSVIMETSGLVGRLYSWVENAKEPLQSYATGLLAVASELSDVATDPENREKNGRIIPIILQRLRKYQSEMMEEVKQGQDISSNTTTNPKIDSPNSNKFKRPFSIFGKKSPVQVRRSSNEALDSSSALDLKKPPDDLSNPMRHNNFSKDNSSLNQGVLFENWSNSSWAEMEAQIICHFRIHPLTLVGKQVFILRLLSPLAEYQEFLSFTVDSGVLELISNYLKVRETRNTRLAFEALRFQAGLFCHKRMVMEWVTTGGIPKLIAIPRPSIASTAVSQVLYYIGCDDDSMEKVCLLPHNLLEDLVKYVLWLIECSHDSGRQFAIMFSYLSFSFRVFLDIFDQKDGIRMIYNTVNTLPILNHEDNRILLSDDQEYLQRQSVRQVMVAYKKYTDAQLALKAEQLKRFHTREFVESRVSVPNYKPNRLSPEQSQECIETLVNFMPFKAKWPPMDKFIQLGGITMCLKVIAIAYDWSCTGRSETVRSALDCLCIAAILPKVQLQLCERIELPDDSKTVGFNILLSAAEGEIIQDSSEVQKASLSVLINCLCSQKGYSSNSSSTTNYCSSSFLLKKKLANSKSAEDLINKVWDCVRTNNGIMALLQLLHTKTPITDADAIRALACKALTGLGRSPAAKQIMSKLPIFTNGELQQLVREPVLLDKRGEHVKFQQYAHDLLELVSGPGPRHLTECNDFSIEMLHRASVVAQTKIRFPKKQLLQLIQEYLASQGLNESVSVLQREANLALLTTKNLHHNRSTPTGNPITPSNSTPSFSSRVTNSASRLISSPSRSSTSLLNNSSIQNTPSTPIPIRLNRASRKLDIGSPSPSMTVLTNRRSDFDNAGISNSHSGVEASKNSLVSIISDYLSSQHSLCKNPMSTCPEFDLFLPHKCPDPRPRMSAPYNFATRYTLRSIFPPFGGPDGRKLDLKLMYGRFRPVKTFRPSIESENRQDNNFSSVAITPDDQFILVGTNKGEVRLFNSYTGAEEVTFQCHTSTVHHIQPSRDGKFVLTSSSWRAPYSNMWSMGEFFESKMIFEHEDYIEFSKVSQDKIIGTANEVAKIYDIERNQVIQTLSPQISNNYSKNRATFDPTDELVLNDGVLYDLRMSKEIRKLDKLNQNLSGVFHPNGLEIVSNTEVWDIRNFHLLKTVPQLDQCHITFTNSGDIIYARTMEQDTEDGDKYESSFKTLDASDYSSIATIETRRSILDLCTSSNDLQLAVVENLPLLTVEESVVRLYDVGRLRADQEDYDEEEDDDKDDEDGQGDDNDSDDSNGFTDLLGSSSDEDDGMFRGENFSDVDYEEEEEEEEEDWDYDGNLQDGDDTEEF
ncbi:DDB1- and CUL4-associated factor 1 isoform X2 [Lepeophtheirus salmonis]|uniref:DDB1- and CUL4-associated factor 1 isoform X2 n=1 Tax=Lepeophtheirus salmonis TaxID=72036 RepID=UPI001AE65C2A|nr:DDB1- and CUL4-associated factor 1-like isoform X2 [Lepeophtheirus salmonis]